MLEDKELEDWTFAELKRWALTELVDAFVVGGSKEMNVRLHWVLVQVMRWSTEEQKKRKKEQTK